MYSYQCQWSKQHHKTATIKVFKKPLKEVVAIIYDVSSQLISRNLKESAQFNHVVGF